MLEFMDMITEAIEQSVEIMIENALFMLGVLTKIVILTTTPVWILPYKLIRDNYRQPKKMNERQDKEDAGNND